MSESSVIFGRSEDKGVTFEFFLVIVLYFFYDIQFEASRLPALTLAKYSQKVRNAIRVALELYGLLEFW